MAGPIERQDPGPARPEAGPILLNARAAARPELGGVERWARETTARLPRLRPGAYAVARPPGFLAHRAGHAWEQVVLPARARRMRAALVFSPANLAPLAWPRNVVVLHDLAALRHPEWYSRAYAAWQRALVPRIARGARHVVTVSEFSRNEIVDLLGVPDGRVSVVAGGVGPELGPDADAAGARRALHLDRPYVLAVGSRIARKNLAALEPVARALADEGVEVVTAGGSRPHFRTEPPAAGVRPLGAVADDLLPGLYAGAEAVVVPSRYEGFGLVCLEAMACGTPVVAARRAALPETCGDAALLVDPDDGDALVAAVRRAVGDASERERLRAAGLARAAAFTWDRAARATDALLARVAGEG